MDPWGGTENNAPVVQFLTFILLLAAVKRRFSKKNVVQKQTFKKVVQKVTLRHIHRFIDLYLYFHLSVYLYIYIYIYACFRRRLPPHFFAFVGKVKFYMFNISAVKIGFLPKKTPKH